MHYAMWGCPSVRTSFYWNHATP